jgi:PIN domain nuclease of toxin-antitoxin system
VILSQQVLVLDAAPVLASFLNEPSADMTAQAIVGHDRVLMSTVNLTEVSMTTRQRQLPTEASLERAFLATKVEFIALDDGRTRADAAKLRSTSASLASVQEDPESRFTGMHLHGVRRSK